MANRLGKGKRSKTDGGGGGGGTVNAKAFVRRLNKAIEWNEQAIKDREEIKQALSVGLEEQQPALLAKLDELEARIKSKADLKPTTTVSATTAANKPKETTKKELKALRKEVGMLKEDIVDWKNNMLKQMEGYLTKEPPQQPPLTEATVKEEAAPPPVVDEKTEEERRQQERIAKLKKQQTTEIPLVVCRPPTQDAVISSFARSQFAKRTLILNEFSGGKRNRKNNSELKNLFDSRPSEKKHK